MDAQTSVESGRLLGDAILPRVILSAAFGSGFLYYLKSLDQLGVLAKAITTRFDARHYVSDSRRVAVNPVPEIVFQLSKRLPFQKRRLSGAYLKATLYDQWALKQLIPADIVSAFSQFGLLTMRRAKDMGAITIVERGSSHSLVYKEIVEEEYKVFGQTIPALDDRLFEREIQEYQEADFISVASTFTYNSFIRQGVESAKLLRIPMGVDTELFRPSTMEDNVFRIVCVAPYLRKGIQYLLEAVRQLKLPNSELVWLGGVTRELEPIMLKYAGFYRHVGKVPSLNFPKTTTEANGTVDRSQRGS